ncbi:hypothetical protein HZS_2479, partial [Henneguya salminicola]
VFAHHNLEFSVRKFTVWKKQDKIIPQNKYDIASYSSLITQSTVLYDVILIFDDFSSRGEHGLAIVDTICTERSIAIVDVGKKTNFTRKYVADTVVHELGHVLGLRHNDCFKYYFTIRLSSCSNQKNIKTSVMSPSFRPWEGNELRSFEKCVLSSHIDDISEMNCLRAPLKLPRLLGKCGDGVMDPKEQCDCGTLELCNNFTKKGLCCDQETCKFRQKTYQCSYGSCCDQCQFKSDSIFCRIKMTECDEVDFCTGNSHLCEPDTIKPDYSLCNTNKGFCFEGNCVSMDFLCKYGLAETFFSHKCVKKLRIKLKTQCVAGNITSHDNDNFCKFGYKSSFLMKRTDVCNHFVCETSQHSTPKYGIIFGDSKTHCLIPKPENRLGFLAHALRFTSCSINSNGTKKYCYNSQCLMSTAPNLSNCINGVCLDMDNDLNVQFIKFQEMNVKINKSLTGENLYMEKIKFKKINYLENMINRINLASAKKYNLHDN